MVDFRISYQQYYEQNHSSKWTGDILDINYLSDLKGSMKMLFDIDRKISPELEKPYSKEQEDKEMR